MFGTKEKRVCFRHKEPAWERILRSQQENTGRPAHLHLGKAKAKG